MKNKQIGFAIRFNETEETKAHLDILREQGKVLWGAWKRSTSANTQYSNRIKDTINKEGSYIYAIGQSTVWKMHVLKAMTTQEVIDEGLEELIPPYYTINHLVYIWYLIDDIKDYENRDCLSALTSSGGKSYENVHQIPGNTPWAVFSSDNKIKHYVPNVISRTVNKYQAERGKLTKSLRYDILMRDNFRCQICGRKVADDPNLVLHVDHIIPISKGGLTTFNNLRTLCQDCNLGKSNKNEIINWFF